MNDKKDMSRRRALKTMGALAAGAVMSASGLSAASNVNLRSDKKMKVLAINGSSRKDGNTADMLNLVLAEIEKAVFYLFGRCFVHTEGGNRKSQCSERYQSGHVPPQSGRSSSC